MVTNQIDWEVIKMQHITWRMKFRSMISSGTGKLDEIQVKDHTQCDMGKWMHSVGVSRYGNDQAFKILLDRHKEFHEVASLGFNAFKNNNITEANNFSQEITVISNDMLELIDVFKDYLAKQSGSDDLRSNQSEIEGLIRMADEERIKQDSKFFGKNYTDAMRLYKKAMDLGSGYAEEMLNRLK